MVLVDAKSVIYNPVGRLELIEIRFVRARAAGMPAHSGTDHDGLPANRGGRILLNLLEPLSPMQGSVNMSTRPLPSMSSSYRTSPRSRAAIEIGQFVVHPPPNGREQTFNIYVNRMLTQCSPIVPA